MTHQLNIIQNLYNELNEIMRQSYRTKIVSIVMSPEYYHKFMTEYSNKVRYIYKDDEHCTSIIGIPIFVHPTLNKDFTINYDENTVTRTGKLEY